MSIEYKDYYATLGVPRSASVDEIKKAFRDLARKYHPDVAKDKKAAEEKFKAINEANEVLSDPEKRRRYDALGPNWKEGAGFGGGGSPFGGGNDWRRKARRPRGANGRAHPFEEEAGAGFSDFFEQFFGAGAHGGPGGFSFEESSDGPRRRRFHSENAARVGADVEGEIRVSLDEVMHGSVRTIAVQRVDPETGESAEHTFKVRIPTGMQEGQSIRVPGQGRAGARGIPAGNLYLKVIYEPHPQFEARGTDLYYDLPVAPWEAVLGATVRVPTLDGPVNVRIPAGSAHGQQMRLRGHGLPRTAEGGRGDLFAVVQVQLPKSLDDSERELWEKLAAGSRFKARADE